jgi:electron transfer flavoprotein alpha subunit
MSILLIGEYRENNFFETSYELIGYANKFNKSYEMFAVGDKKNLPKLKEKLYLADSTKYKEYNPEIHKNLIVELVKKYDFEEIVFLHSSYGWDLAPRVAYELDASLITGIVDRIDDVYVKPVLNGKLDAQVKAEKEKVVITIQTGVFTYEPEINVMAEIEELDIPLEKNSIEFVGYEEAVKLGVDLSKASIIVSVGRGIGKKENIKNAEELAKRLNGELGASRPIVDAGWLDYSRQVRLTGQTVSPKLYIACGISGSIQHLAGMKKSNYIIAINTDKEAPISEVADVLVVADANEIIKELLKLLEE